MTKENDPLHPGAARGATSSAESKPEQNGSRGGGGDARLKAKIPSNPRQGKVGKMEKTAHQPALIETQKLNVQGGRGVSWKHANKRHIQEGLDNEKNGMKGEWVGRCKKKKKVLTNKNKGSDPKDKTYQKKGGLTVMTYPGRRSKGERSWIPQPTTTYSGEAKKPQHQNGLTFSKKKGIKE